MQSGVADGYGPLRCCSFHFTQPRDSPFPLSLTGPVAVFLSRITPADDDDTCLYQVTGPATTSTVVHSTK